MVAQDNGSIKFVDTSAFDKKFLKTECNLQGAITDKTPENYFALPVIGEGKTRDEAAKNLI